MKTISHLLISALTGAALLAGGCGNPASLNPKELWIGLNGSETKIQLVPVQPSPF